ncbi:PIN domain-containing protein [Ideonella sp.]|uniref:PIN domain-containing protein n=1 Tax=Ideonella sp. TaxID=1929293 RepID=UPI003BB4E034
MSSPVMLDTSVLLACFDDSDLDRRDQARAWVALCWTRRSGRITVQALNEFYSASRKRFASAISAGDARAEVRRYQHWRPWQVDHPTVETAWAIESRFGLTYADALIVASAQHQSCSTLLTERLAHGLQFDGVRIINPFRVAPEGLDTASS